MRLRVIIAFVLSPVMVCVCVLKKRAKRSFVQLAGVRFASHNLFAHVHTAATSLLASTAVAAGGGGGGDDNGGGDGGDE